MFARLVSTARSAPANIAQPPSLPIVATVVRPFATVLTNPPSSTTSTPLPLSVAAVHGHHISSPTTSPKSLVANSINATASSSHRIKPIPEYPVSASISLASGHSFSGQCYGAPVSSAGEVVFTTALVGYPESLTDPSYAGQILVLTQPLVGNYGVPAPNYHHGLATYYESARIHARALVVQDYTWQFSHRDAIMSLGAWCASHGVPLLSGIDTRELVRILRSSGSTMGAVQVSNGPLATLPPSVNPDVVPSVSTRAPVVFGRGGTFKIAVMDFGAKHNILRSVLAGNGDDTEVTLLPWDYPIHQVIDQFDGLVLSNGPGDPRHMSIPVKHIRNIVQDQASRPDMHKTPILGICMGNQVLGMAAGLSTHKLKYGNRGHNQPCLDLINGGCVITSQNHGYVLDDSNMPVGWRTFYRNANDQSNEGIWGASGKWRAVQFHPEACGGPTDTMHLFESFANDVKAFHDLRTATKLELAIPQTIKDAAQLSM